MAIPVLATKLFIPPPRSPGVARPRLIERLHEGLRSGHKLTLICAPAGFGKTTVLSEWIADVRRLDPRIGVAWLSLDESDNDISRFLTYLVAALRSADPGVGADLPESLGVEATLTALLNDVALAPQRTIFVLDDFQVIEGAPIRDALAFLLDHLPSNLHVAIGTRSDPPLPLARLRSRGELTELRASDLRFAPPEAEIFLNQVMGLALSPQHIAALDARTEGWVAGLQLAALSMRERSDIAGFIEAFAGSHRFVIDYLGEEVLSRQPEQVRSFLLQTAFLDRLNGGLCEAVTGRADSGELLATLERENLFVVPLDDKRQWYRYHHLFADVLRARSLREDPDRVPTLHGLASEWHEANDLHEEAVKHALAAADFERAARLIERALPELRRGRQDATLRGWLMLLPDEIAERRPVLSVCYAWSALVAGDLAAVEHRLDAAELSLVTVGGVQHHDSAVGEELRMLPVTIAVYRASLAQARGDVVGTEMHARRALQLTLPGDNLGGGSAAGLLALALWAKGDLEGAVRTFGEARAFLELAGHTTDLIASTVVLADMLLVQGHRLAAGHAYEQAVRLSTTQDGQPTSDLHVGMSEWCREAGEMDVAVEHLRAGKVDGARVALPENRHRWFVAMARIRESEGDLDSAFDLLSEAERLYVRGFVPDVTPIDSMKVRIAITQRRFTFALAWVEEQGLSAADDVSYLREYRHVTLARLLIARHRVDRQGAIDEAIGLLGRLLAAAEDAGRGGSVNEILLLTALAHQAHGQMELAMVPLARVLDLAEPEGFVRLFVDEGQPMLELLGEASRRGVAPRYVQRLQNAFATAQRAPAVAPSSLEALSERELHVLRLLASELNGPQIARELFVSLNTFRTHTRHIFDKLGVNSRQSAVRRARELGLL